MPRRVYSTNCSVVGDQQFYTVAFLVRHSSMIVQSRAVCVSEPVIPDEVERSPGIGVFIRSRRNPGSALGVDISRRSDQGSALGDRIKRISDQDSALGVRIKRISNQCSALGVQISRRSDNGSTDGVRVSRLGNEVTADGVRVSRLGNEVTADDVRVSRLGSDGTADGVRVSRRLNRDSVVSEVLSEQIRNLEKRRVGSNNEDEDDETEEDIRWINPLQSSMDLEVDQSRYSRVIVIIRK